MLWLYSAPFEFVLVNWYIQRKGKVYGNSGFQLLIDEIHFEKILFSF